jgi:hypothetical protein
LKYCACTTLLRTQGAYTARLASDCHTRQVI